MKYLIRARKVSYTYFALDLPRGLNFEGRLTVANSALAAMEANEGDWQISSVDAAPVLEQEENVIRGEEGVVNDALHRLM